MISKIIFGVILLIAVGGFGLAVWGTYQMIHTSTNSGLVQVAIGGAMMGFAGIAVSIAGKFLHF